MVECQTGPKKNKTYRRNNIEREQHMDAPFIIQKTRKKGTHIRIYRERIKYGRVKSVSYT